MDNIILETKKLIDTFEKSDLIKNLEYYREKVIFNSALLELINKHNNSLNDYEKIALKEKIYKYEDYKLFMKYYNELFYYILDINNRLKKYTDVRSHNESN